MELEHVRDQVGPLALAHERTLPLADALTPLLPESSLVRGRILSCQGPAATSLILALVSSAVSAGSWMALVDVPHLGLDAAREQGVALERIVRVDSHDWPSTIAAALDGFDIVVTTVPVSVRRAAVTMLSSRIRQRGAVVIVSGRPGELGADAVFDTARTEWVGLGAGHGVLRRRHADVRSHGRRVPGGRRSSVLLPGADGGCRSASAPPSSLVLAG